MTVTRPDGETCFAEEDIPLTAAGPAHAVSQRYPARHVSFRWTPGHFDMDFHLAPRRRLVLVLEGGLAVRTSDGDSRVFHPGDVWEIRDTSGKGHCSRAFQGKPFRSLFVALDDEITLDRRAPLTETPDRAEAVWIAGTAGTGYRRASLPYALGGIEGWVTDEYPATGFRFVVSGRGGEIVGIDDRPPTMECVLSGRYGEIGAGAAHDVATGEIVCRRTEPAPRRRAVVGGNGLFLSIVAEADLPAEG